MFHVERDYEFRQCIDTINGDGDSSDGYGCGFGCGNGCGTSYRTYGNGKGNGFDHHSTFDSDNGERICILDLTSEMQTITILTLNRNM